MGKFVDLTGQKFGRWTVIKRVENSKGGKARWLCKCDCGSEKIVLGVELRKGTTKSCGCYNSDQARERWTNKNFRERKINQVKEKWQDEDFRKMQSEQRRKLNEEQWKNEEYRKKMSTRMKDLWQDEEYKVSMTGENSPSYNSNLTDEDREDRRLCEGYSKWVYSVKENANFTCDICGQHGYDLISHHLDSYNWCKEKRTDVSNGVCLCTKCHKEFHRRYGQGNNTKEQYIEFKKIMLRG